MSDANRTAVRFIEESTFAVTPAAPAFQELRYNSSSLAYSPKTVISDEIRSDRQISDVILVGYETSGDISTELSYGNLDTLMCGALFSDWTLTPERTNVTADSIITDVAASTGTYTVSSGAAFATGMLVRATGFTNSANNGVFVSTGGSATSAVFGSGAGMVNETAPPAGARLKVVGAQAGAADVAAITSPANRLTSTTLNWTTLGLAVGMWVKIGGTAAGTKFATTANNGWARISAVAATYLEFDVVPAGWSADTGTGKTIRVFWGDYMRNGTTERSFTIEQAYEGLITPEYEYYTGMEVSNMSFEMSAQDIMKASMSFMGSQATIGTTRFASATTVAAPTNDVLNTSSHVGSIREGGSAVSGPNYVTAVKFSIDNNLRMQNAVGQAGAIGIGVGRANISGSLSTYFGSSALLAKLRANTATSYDFRLQDPSGTKAYIFDMPRIKFSGGNPEVSGVDTDMMIELGFTAIRHPTLGYTIQAQRVEYYES